MLPDSRGLAPLGLTPVDESRNIDVSRRYEADDGDRHKIQPSQIHLGRGT